MPKTNYIVVSLYTEIKTERNVSIVLPSTNVLLTVPESECKSRSGLSTFIKQKCKDFILLMNHSKLKEFHIQNSDSLLKIDESIIMDVVSIDKVNLQLYNYLSKILPIV